MSLLTRHGWVAERPGGAPVWRERPAAVLAAHQVLVEVSAAVVGAAELHAFDAGGAVPGGGAVGVVVAAGEAATHRVGQRVLVGPTAACGECALCSRGRPAVCATRRRLGLDLDGALASHVVADARWVCPLVGALDGVVPGPAAAALPRDALLAYEMLARAGVAPGETTIWLGGGPIARLGRELAQAKGAFAVSLTDDELRLPPGSLPAALIARLGEDAVSPWKVFETSGRSGWRGHAVGLATPGAVLALAGAGATGAALDGEVEGIAALLDRDVTILGVAGGHPDLVPELTALVAKGEVDLAATVEIIGPADLERALTALRTGIAGERLFVLSPVEPPG